MFEKKIEFHVIKNAQAISNCEKETRQIESKRWNKLINRMFFFNRKKWNQNEPNWMALIMFILVHWTMFMLLINRKKGVDLLKRIWLVSFIYFSKLHFKLSYCDCKLHVSSNEFRPVQHGRKCECHLFKVKQYIGLNFEPFF